MSVVKVSKIYASGENNFAIQIPSSAKLNIQGNFAIVEGSQLKLPVGTTAERPSTPANGMVRFNSTEDTVEGYDGNTWVNLMSAAAAGGGAGIPQQGLVFHLDANDPDSLLAQGQPDDNYWYDVSDTGGSYRFGIPTDRMSSFVNQAGETVRFMDFSENGSGCAKYDSLNGDLPWFPHCSWVMFLRWRTTDSQWRTPLRSWHANHQIIVQDGTKNLGMYDNDANGFQDTGYDINQFPEWNTKFNMYTWRFGYSTGGSYTPCYQCFFKNEANARATINNGSSTYDRAPYHIGAWGEGNSNPHSSSQNAGAFGVIMYYNRFISQAERQQIYDYYKDTYDI